MEKTVLVSGHTLRTCIVDGNMWFCGIDAAAALNYKDPKKAILPHVARENKKSYTILMEGVNIGVHHAPGRARQAIYINRDGMISLLVKAKMLNKEAIIGEINELLGCSIECHSVIGKEQATIQDITTAFSHVNSEFQYVVGNYRIDLYFPDARIAVECDEFDHRNRDPVQEAKRQNYLTARLKCKFVRYNPDDPSFSILEVINRIMCIMYVQPNPEANSTHDLVEELEALQLENDH